MANSFSQESRLKIVEVKPILQAETFPEAWLKAKCRMMRANQSQNSFREGATFC
jgi:hypothetical protein